MFAAPGHVAATATTHAQAAPGVSRLQRPSCGRRPGQHQSRGLAADQRDAAHEQDRPRPPARRPPGARPVRGDRPAVLVRRRAPARQVPAPPRADPGRHGRDLQVRPQRAARRPRQRHALRRPVGRRAVGRLQAVRAAHEPARPHLRRPRPGLRLRKPWHQHHRRRAGPRLRQGPLRPRERRLRARRRHPLHQPSRPAPLHDPQTASASLTTHSGGRRRSTVSDAVRARAARQRTAGERPT